jgi:hypothetical protein
MNLHDYDDWLAPLASALGAVLLGMLVHAVARPVVRRLARQAPVAGAVTRRIDRPTHWLLPLIAVQVALEGAPDELPHVDGVRQLVTVLLIAAFTATATAAVRGVVDAALLLHPQDVADNLQARRVLTQARVLARIAIGLALFTGAAFILMTFPRARP